MLKKNQKSFKDEYKNNVNAENIKKATDVYILRDKFRIQLYQIQDLNMIFNNEININTLYSNVDVILNKKSDSDDFINQYINQYINNKYILDDFGEYDIINTFEDNLTIVKNILQTEKHIDIVPNITDLLDDKINVEDLLDDKINVEDLLDNEITVSNFNDYIITLKNLLINDNYSHCGLLQYLTSYFNIDKFKEVSQISDSQTLMIILASFCNMYRMHDKEYAEDEKLLNDIKNSIIEKMKSLEIFTEQYIDNIITLLNDCNIDIIKDYFAQRNEKQIEALDRKLETCNNDNNTYLNKYFEIYFTNRNNFRFSKMFTDIFSECVPTNQMTNQEVPLDWDLQTNKFDKALYMYKFIIGKKLIDNIMTFILESKESGLDITDQLQSMSTLFILDKLKNITSNNKEDLDGNTLFNYLSDNTKYISFSSIKINDVEPKYNDTFKKYNEDNESQRFISENQFYMLKSLLPKSEFTITDDELDETDCL